MTTQTAERTHERRGGLFSRSIGIPMQLVGILLVSLLCSILIEWAGIFWEWWAQPGAEHARMTMEREMGWLDSEFSRSLVVSRPVESATWFIGMSYEWVFVKTGISPFLESNANSGGWLGTLNQYMQAAVYVTLMTLTRVVILVLTSPLFALAGLVGVVDGLVRRDLRRFGAGRESAFIYHHAKRMVGPVFVVGWIIYLSVPFAIHPNVFLLPCAALFGLLVSVATGSFKKYL
ncbi:TIGR03747 family integrating conjugative element membrane protein [Billgrantia lactosivorans]|uniref:TIGR03747 family integrating conjugative element membrane protein n=1 Tax=Billgrantia lactosivorans TaxID=2185141 RepID=UPI000DAD1613|nr:TIGR03747 family integrating conjugative element membrane protein [Halomonas lactosivorans]